MASTFIGCNESVNTLEPDTIYQSILGTWVPEGFENNVRYEFTEEKRYTLYASDEAGFPSLAEFLEENPGIHGNEYYYDGETIVVDLHFGNESRLVPNYKCGNFVIDWTNEDGEEWGTYFRVGHDMSECN